MQRLQNGKKGSLFSSIFKGGMAVRKSLSMYMVAVVKYFNHRPREIGRAWLGKIARFEKLKDLCSVFQNGLAFLGQIGKAS